MEEKEFESVNESMSPELNEPEKSENFKSSGGQPINEIQSVESIEDSPNGKIQKNSAEPKVQAEIPNQGSGQSAPAADPNNALILGKFKSVDDLITAYQELQQLQGSHSAELGDLRKQMASVSALAESCNRLKAMRDGMLETVKRDREQFNTPEYFQDPTFTEIYREAFLALGDKLDTQKFVNLLEAYVSSRIFANERKKAAKIETDKVIDSMSYNKNPKTSFTPPKKSIDEMSPKELDEFLDRII